MQRMIKRLALACGAWTAWAALLLFPAGAWAAPLILNEYNAVGSTRYLGGASYSESEKEDAFFKTVPGLPDGRIQGNGGNWIELVVIEDHLDIRGWELRWAEVGSMATDGTDIWFGNPNVDQGIITFSPTAAVWSDLRTGAIITISEQISIGVDTDFQGLNRNFTSGVAEEDVDVTIDLSTDASFNPSTGDWWIHVSTLDEQNEASPLVTTITNVMDNGPGNFSVGNDDWLAQIHNTADTLVFGPVGESVTLGGGVGSTEVFKLEGPISPATLADWQAVTGTSMFYNDGTSSSLGLPNVFTNEEAQELMQDFLPLRPSIGPLTGDMDCDDDVDFDDIDEFILGLNDAAAYESLFGLPPAVKGDTDGDADIDFDDIAGFVTLLSGAGDTAAVPEPSAVAMALAGIGGLFVFVRAAGVARGR